MAYERTVWVNDQQPDLDDANLNKMEKGIADAHDAIDNLTVQLNTGGGGLAAHLADLNNPHRVTQKQIASRYTINAESRGASPALANNWTILQGILDEIRDSGRERELYIPRLGGAAYKTENLYVPSNCRIVSDGAVLQGIGDGGPAHARLHFTEAAHDGQPAVEHAVAPRGILSGSSQGDLGLGNPTGVYIEGLTLLIPDGSLYPAGHPAIGISVQGADWIVKDVVVDGVAVGAGVEINWTARALLERVRVLHAGRNAWELLGGEDIRLYDCEGMGTTAGGSGDPGAGIDVEVEQDSLRRLHMRGCYFHDNAGAGISLVLKNAQDVGVPVEDVLIEDCVIAGNGLQAYAGITLGGIFFARQAEQNRSRVRVIGNAIRNQVRGAALQGHTTPGCRQMDVIAVGNDLTNNAGGAIAGLPDAGYTLTETANLS